MEKDRNNDSLLQSPNVASPEVPVIEDWFSPQPPMPFDPEDTSSSLNDTGVNLENLLFVGTNGYVLALDVSAGLAAEPREVWRTNLAGTGSNPVVIIFSLPNFLYCGSNSNIYKLQCETGEVIWKAANRSSLTSLWLNQDKLLVGSGGYVECLDPETGSSKWKSNLVGAGYSVTSMIVIGKELVAGCAGYLFSFDIDTGAQLWTDPLKGYGWGPITFAVVDNSEGKRLLFVGANGNLIIYDWMNKRQLASHVLRSMWNASPVALVPHEGNLWLSNSEIRLIDGLDLQIKHHDKLEGTGYGCPSLDIFTLPDGRRILIEGHMSTITCIDLATKRHLWVAGTHELKRVPSMILHGNILYAGSGGFVEAFEPSSGRRFWSLSLRRLDYCNVTLATIFSTTNVHSNQLITIDYSLI